MSSRQPKLEDQRRSEYKGSIPSEVSFGQENKRKLGRVQSTGSLNQSSLQSSKMSEEVKVVEIEKVKEYKVENGKLEYA